MNNDLISRSEFSNTFNSAVFAKLHNEYLNSTANQELKDVAEFVTTDIMIIFNNLIESAPSIHPIYYADGTIDFAPDMKGGAE